MFFRQKCDTFARSSDAVFELSTRFATPWTQAEGLSQEQLDAGKRAIFLELTQICLWGNSTDLSLLINVSLTLLYTLRLLCSSSVLASFVLLSDHARIV